MAKLPKIITQVPNITMLCSMNMVWVVCLLTNMKPWDGTKWPTMGEIAMRNTASNAFKKNLTTLRGWKENQVYCKDSYQIFGLQTSLLNGLSSYQDVHPAQIVYTQQQNQVLAPILQNMKYNREHLRIRSVFGWFNYIFYIRNLEVNQCK